MAEKIVIIGAVALGPKAACRCKRLRPDADVTMIDQNLFISYGGCGIPYYISGEIQYLDSLRSTNAGAIRDPDFFREMKDVNVMVQTRALAINRDKKTVLVENLVSGEKSELPYDRLVLATGARARIPPLEGVALGGVMSLTRLEMAQAIREQCEKGLINEAVVVGGSFIGLEAAVALADMWGVKVSVVEMMDQLLPGVATPTTALMAENDCRAHKVEIFTSEKAQKLVGENGHVTRLITDKRELPCQLVIFATGFIPNSELAKDAGLEVEPFGGIKTDEHLLTSDKSIYAGGDCAAIKNIITGKYGYLPLGGEANRQGRVIGSNLGGQDRTFPGYVGTWMIKLFDMAYAGVGLTPQRARDAGFDAIGVSIEQLDHAHFYPDKEMMSLEIVVDRKTRRVLGLQGACADGPDLKARIDAVAGVLEYGKPTIEDISNLEVAYSPPYASAMDAVNTVANVADNVVSGLFKVIDGVEFMKLWHDRKNNDIYFIDMRPPKASKKVEAEYPDWHAIPLEYLKARLSEIPKDRPIAVICNSGTRAYEGVMFLQHSGIKDIVDSMGGMKAVGKMGLKP